MRGAIAVIVVAALTGAASTQPPSMPTAVLRDTLPTGVTPAMIATGQKLFAGSGYCSSCHGADARGRIGPDLTDADWWHSDGTPSAIAQTIRSGVPERAARHGVAMPPRGGSSLSDAEVEAVAAYVWTLRGSGQLTSGSARGNCPQGAPHGCRMPHRGRYGSGRDGGDAPRAHRP